MMKMARINRTEWEGDRICAIRDSTRVTRVRTAAIIWTIKILDNAFLAEAEREKSSGGSCRGKSDRFEFWAEEPVAD